ncbi:MAG: hypothetical protein BGN92_09350 [Sphingobacteriales bacterium 41-5]|nr:MAG: hypothetical protein BGN92_09350 [Sphingobacteriales bacterium 41-5]
MKLITAFLFCLFLSVGLEAQTVYKTPSGAKYHTANCRMVKNVSSKVSLKDAAASGLTACKICKPATVSAMGLVSKPTQGQDQTKQCKGLTKKGSRCQHMTRIGNGYCFQHQP